MIERHAARALLISPAEELLLIKIVNPHSQRFFWLTPGGGLDPGESPAAGLRREIFEETGLTDFEIGPEVWYREHLFHWGDRAILQKERYYLVRVAHFEPTFRHLPTEGERLAFGGFRWWRAEEIEQSPEAFAPRGLGHLLQTLLQNGPPPQPIILNG